MKIFLSFLLSLTSIFSLSAHEGHDSSIGAGTVITTAIEMGNKSHRFVTVPGWGDLPEGENLGLMHGDLCLDRRGQVYLSRHSNKGITIFTKHGSYLKTIAPHLDKLHSMTMVQEGEEEFIWAAQYRQNRAVKFNLKGEIVSILPNENTGQLEGGPGGLTDVTILPDGTILLCMGYGSNKIHKLNPDGTLIKSIASKGKQDLQFQTCHKATVDSRYEKPRILVCDRENRRLIHLTLDLDWIGVYGEPKLRRPADVAIRGDLVAVAELAGRVSLMDKSGQIVATLGDNPEKALRGTNKVKALDLKDRFFSAPHGITWGPQGQLYITEWSKVGRVIALYPLH